MLTFKDLQEVIDIIEEAGKNVLEIYHSNEFELLLSRQDLADFSGMSKDSAIRIIKELENEGIIRAATKKISILQPETLQQIALKG